MRKLAVTILSLVSMSLSAQASPSDAMKSYLSSKIRGKSVGEVLCKWSDEVAVTNADVLQLKEMTLSLIPQLGIPALKNVSGDLRITGSPHCTDKPSTFGVAGDGFSLRVYIGNTNGQESYRIGITDVTSKQAASIYSKVAPLAQMGLGANVMENAVKAINKAIVPITAQPISMKLGDINGVGSLSINFSNYAKAGELFSLSLMEDGKVMFLNQINVDLDSATTASAETYQITSVARCICNASMSVTSDSGKSGFVLDSQKVSSIKIRAGGKEVVLNNPPQGIRSYYAGAESDEWVKAELAKKGIKLGANDSVGLISFTGSIALYDDSDANNQIQE